MTLLVLVVGVVAAVLGSGLVFRELLKSDPELWQMSPEWMRERGWRRW